MLKFLAIVGGLVVGSWILRVLMALVMVAQRNRRITKFETETFMARGCREDTPEERRRDMIHIWTEFHGVPQAEAERRYDELERTRRHPRASGATDTSSTISGAALIRGAATSPLRADLPLPELDEFAQELLSELYGSEWLAKNEDLLRAMLAYAEDFHALEDDIAGLREFMADDASESCLLNIFNCMRCAGAFTQPTIPKRKPDVSDFMLAFSNGDLTAFADPTSTIFALRLAVRLAPEVSQAA